MNDFHPGDRVRITFKDGKTEEGTVLISGCIHGNNEKMPDLQPTTIKDDKGQEIKVTSDMTISKIK